MNANSANLLSTLLTRDYTPWANRYVYWLKTPFGVLVAAALSALLIGWFVTPQGYAIVGAIAGVLTIGVAWPWIGLRGIRCSIAFPQTRCEEGADIVVNVEVANRWPFPVWGLAIERGFFANDDEGNPAVVSLSRIPGWSTCRFAFPFRPVVRGVYPQAAPQVTTEFPFGLWKARRSCAADHSLLVWPQIYPLSSLPLQPGTSQHLFSPSDQRAGDEGERIGARPYRQGDSLRNVHWAQTARCDRLIVCERQGAAQTDVCIVINCQSEYHRGQGIDATMQWGLRIGASVAASLMQQNVRVTVEMGSLVFPLDLHPASWRKMNDAMARLTPACCVRSPSRRRNGVVIAVRTNLAEPLSYESRAIVLNAVDGGPEISASASAAAKPWISIESMSTAAAEFHQGWSKRRKEAWRHV